jgi:hypothetical protein
MGLQVKNSYENINTYCLMAIFFIYGAQTLYSQSYYPLKRYEKCKTLNIQMVKSWILSMHLGINKWFKNTKTESNKTHTGKAVLHVRASPPTLPSEQHTHAHTHKCACMHTFVHNFYSTYLNDLGIHWWQIQIKMYWFCASSSNKPWRHIIPYILESNPHPVFGDFLNEKKKVSSRF